MVNQIRLNILGSSHVLTVQSEARLYSKAVAVLAYLALSGRTTRRLLADLLWDGAPDGLNNVSATRTHLIAELGDGVLVSTPETLELGADVRCDALEWLHDASRASVELWRGDLLEGLKLREWRHGLGGEFQDWLEDVRQRHRTERLDRAARYAQDDLRQGELSSAQYWLERATADILDPREEASRCLMLVRGLARNAEAAVRVFQDLQHSLRQSLDIEPTAESRHALELARSGDVAACRATLLLPALSSTSSVVANLPLVGRKTLIERIHKLLKPKGINGMVAVILTGEPGLGKTSIVAQIEQSLSLAHHYSLAVLADSPPLEAVRQLARQITQEPETTETLHNDLACLLPQSSPQSYNDLELRIPLALKALQRHLTQQPSLLIVEDLHWADSATLNWLSEVMAQPLANELKILLSARPTSDLEMLGATLDTWSAQMGLQRVPLEPLSVEDLKALAQHLDHPEVDVTRLRSLSGGNPLYALEWLRGHDENASTVKDLIRTRVKGLPSAARQTLEALAVLGGQADLGQISAVSGRGNHELIEALQLLERLALVSLEGNAFALNHDLTREAVYQDLASTRKALLHLRAARATRATPSIAAPHFYASSAIWTRADASSAGRAMDVLIERYGLHGDLAGAVTWLERATSVASTDAERLRLQLRKAELLARHGRHTETMTLLDEAQSLLSFVPDAVLHAQAALITARVYARELNDLERVQHFASTAMVQIEGLRSQKGQLLRAEALTLLGLVQQQRGEAATALEHYQAALVIWQHFGQQTRMAEALNNIAGIQFFKQNYSEASALWKQVFEIRSRLGDLIGMAAIYNNLTALEWRQDHLEMAQVYNQKAELIHLELGHYAELAQSQENRGIILFLRHQCREAVAAYRCAINTNKQHRQRIKAELHLNIAEALYRISELTEASQHVQAFWVALKHNAREDTPLALYTHLFESDLSQDLGIPDQAKSHLILADELSTKLGDTASSAEVQIRFLALDANQEHLETAFTTHRQHPEWAARLALALYAASGQTDAITRALEVTIDPWWKTRLQAALKSQQMVQEH